MVVFGRAAIALLLLITFASSAAQSLIDFAATGTPAEVQAALEAGADPNMVADDGTTPLLAAVEFNSPEVVHILAEYGADLGYRNPQTGKTIHMLAARNPDSRAMYRLFLELEASIRVEPPQRRGSDPNGDQPEAPVTEARPSSRSGAIAGSSELRDLPALVDFQGSTAQTTWMLTYHFESSEHPAIAPDALAENLFGPVSANLRAANEAYLSYYSREVAQAVGSLRALGDQRVTYMKSIGHPVQFFEHAGSTGVLLGSIGLQFTFNTFATEPVERYRDVLFDKVVPGINKVAEAFEGTDIQYVGIGVAYGIGDFTDEQRPTESEVVTAVFPIQAVDEFSRFSISDVELVGRSLVFAGVVSSVRRVDVNR